MSNDKRTADDAKCTVLYDGRIGSLPASLDAENLTYLYALKAQLHDWTASVAETIARIENIEKPRAVPPPSMHDLVQDVRGTLTSVANALDDLRDAVEARDLPAKAQNDLSRLINTIESVTRDFDALTADRSAE